MQKMMAQIAIGNEPALAQYQFADVAKAVQLLDSAVEKPRTLTLVDQMIQQLNHIFKIIIDNVYG
jgi:hypothetical protein